MNRLNRPMPYGWDLNVYRGCSHGCAYCFAQYTHGYLGREDFFSGILVKTNIAEQLERRLHSPSWKREVVNLGGISDSYQSAEAHYRLMPDVLRLLIRYRTPAIILTKSDLILRDYDLIAELSRLTYVNVAATVTTMDEAVRRKLEPGAPDSARRVAMLREFRKTEASVGLHAMPIIPGLTDGRQNLEALFTAARDAGVHYLLPGTLYLRGRTRPAFFDFLSREFSALHDPLKTLYRSGSAGKEYKDTLYATVNALRLRYGVSGNYSAIMREKLGRAADTQLSLF